MAARPTGHRPNDDDDDKSVPPSTKQESGGKSKADMTDPAEQPGSTGNSPTVSGGISKKPTEADDEAAKKEAAETNEKVTDALGGGYRKAAQIEAKAISDGASALGKERVVVTDDRGNPVTAVRGMSDTALQTASATNPTLMANNAVAQGRPPPEAPAAESKTGKEGEDVPEVIIVTDLHGKGGQPHAG